MQEAINECSLLIEALRQLTGEQYELDAKALYCVNQIRDTRDFLNGKIISPRNNGSISDSSASTIPVDKVGRICGRNSPNNNKATRGHVGCVLRINGRPPRGVKRHN